MKETILVVERKQIEHLLTTNYGFIPAIDYNHLNDLLVPMERDLAESDISFKQIIPYVVLKDNNKVLLYKRTKKTSESKLHEKYSIGIGGHLDLSDKSQDSIMTGLLRELDEEVDVKITNLRFLGYINDDLNLVGQVHLGLVFIAESDSELKVKETDKMEAKWEETNNLSNYPNLESWSQIIKDKI